eukprot:111758-Chlamydomonas_euryale.AAC.17
MPCAAAAVAAGYNAGDDNDGLRRQEALWGDLPEDALRVGNHAAALHGARAIPARHMCVCDITTLDGSASAS